jgi:hypothetical protein
MREKVSAEVESNSLARAIVRFSLDLEQELLRG